jgi:hypothetical protein
MISSVVDRTVVHGWCGFVEKSNDVVFSQMVLNKLWIPDDMINEIKDYLYISAAEVLRKFYRFNINRSITDMVSESSYLIDVYGRQRIAHWAIGHIYGGGNTEFQGLVCVTCGDFSERHQNINGCCALMWDIEDEPIHLVDDEEFDQQLLDETIDEINAEAEEIPEVTWDLDIPSSQQAQIIRTALQQAREESYDDYDREAEAADYAEYMREVEMEMYESRR